jgi:hypothetical protein
VQDATVVCNQELGDCRHRTFACEAHRSTQEQDGGVLHFPPIIKHGIGTGQTAARSAPSLARRVLCETDLWQAKKCSGRMVGYAETGLSLLFRGGC